MTKKTLLSFLLMTAGVLGLGFIAPWWAAALWVVFIAGIMRLTIKEGMLWGGFAIGLVWVVMARYMSSQDDAGIISKTGALLGGLSHQLMMIVTLLIAFITGMLSGWLGSALGSLFIKKPTPEKV